MYVNGLLKCLLAFLDSQRSYENLAEEKKLNLVEMREENYNFPQLLAAPEKRRTSSEIPSSEDLEFNHVSFIILIL